MKETSASAETDSDKVEPKRPTSIHEAADQIADAIFSTAEPPDPARRVRGSESRRAKAEPTSERSENPS